jgi:iron(III) transport system permease protein
LEATRNTVVVALVAATAVALLSVLTSWVVVRSKAPGRRLLDTLAFLPLALPGIMVGVALIYVYLTINFVPIYGTIWILVVAYVTIYIAFGTRLMNGVMYQLSPDLEEAAATSGSAWSRTFRCVTLPLMFPAVAAVWIWVVTHVMRELSSALILQGRNNIVLSTLLWDYWSSGKQVTAAAVGVWLIIALLLLLGGWQLASSRRRL